MNNELRLSGVSKVYPNGKKALKGVSLVFTPGIYGLLGPNGAGKSTMFNIITGGLRATGGEVSYLGKSIKELKREYKKCLGYMPQQQGIYECFTGRQFLWYMAALKGMKKKAAAEQINTLLEVVSLKAVENRKLGSYSGGMKQRILLAQALLDDPGILILDEPTAGLTPKERIRIRNFISEIAKDKIVIIATHVVQDIECIAKDIVLLGDGNVIDEGRPKELMQKLHGSVWEMTVTAEVLPQIQREYCVSNIVSVGDEFRVRIVSEEGGSGFSEAEPSLEDAYLYHFQYDGMRKLK